MSCRDVPIRIRAVNDEETIGCHISRNIVNKDGFLINRR